MGVNHFSLLKINIEALSFNNSCFLINPPYVISIENEMIRVFGHSALRYFRTAVTFAVEVVGPKESVLQKVGPNIRLKIINSRRSTRKYMYINLSNSVSLLKM
jgi:hypothetical protein